METVELTGGKHHNHCWLENNVNCYKLVLSSFLLIPLYHWQLCWFLLSGNKCFPLETFTQSAQCSQSGVDWYCGNVTWPTLLAVLGHWAFLEMATDNILQQLFIALSLQAQGTMTSQPVD